jgi:signal transduction histidine kinase
MLLTGKAGFADAMQVINEGYIFRFLSKPCPPEVVMRALDDAVEQHRLRTADRALLESRVAEVSSQLLRAERLATLGTLATGVGHELANVTTVFFSLVGAVRDAFEEGRPPVQRDVEELERLGEHMRQHAKHLLNLGRPRADVIKVVDLTTVVRETLDLLKVVGKIKRLEVTFDAPDAELLVKASRMQLEQVLLNLVGNAADAIESSGQREGAIRVRLWAEPDRGEHGSVACSIEDNGSGIPKDNLQSIFEPYFTTKPAGKGTGLGLAVVREIIGGYGSEIGVQSEVGKGTTFTFRLPCATEEEDLGPSLAPPGRISSQRQVSG